VNLPRRTGKLVGGSAGLAGGALFARVEGVWLAVVVGTIAFVALVVAMAMLYIAHRVINGPDEAPARRVRELLLDMLQWKAGQGRAPRT
jgi:hypothetical protein